MADFVNEVHKSSGLIRLLETFKGKLLFAID